MQQITTQRLLLRAPKETDARFFHEYSTDPKVAPSAGWGMHSSMKDSLSMLKEFAMTGGVWAIVDKLTNRMIGMIGLVDDPKRSNPKAKMIGYALDENFWGQGMATEASRAVIDFGFNAMRLDIISAYLYTYNQRSKKVLAKCGFRLEGVLRKTSLSVDGQYLDEACYSLTLQEYIKDKQTVF